MRLFRRRRFPIEITPEDIFIDSTNLPRLDEGSLEGRVERPISSRAIASVGLLCALALVVFAGQAFRLQVVEGSSYADISRNNRLERSVIFAPRGVVTDRNGAALAWNEIETDPQATSSTPFPYRRHTDLAGFSHVLGFVRYPKADASGRWWSEDHIGIAGIEAAFNETLAGKNGSIMQETDARGGLVRTDIVDPPREGGELTLSIDAEVQDALARRLAEHIATQKFRGAAAAIMDVENGELLALVSIPEYDTEAFAEGNTEIVAAANTDPTTPLLNRAVAGLYAPGSIVKPMFAAAALEENLISPQKQIFSAGSISIPNPYFPEKPSIFKDWRAHGWTDMRRAIAVSSDVYFYAIGGGFEDQRGLGIARIDDYAKRFGFGEVVNFALPGGLVGTIPTPEWKQEVFDEDWRLGDTYNTAIGQYGFQVTLLQVLRHTAAIANGGRLLDPQLLLGAQAHGSVVGIQDEYLQIAREGMREAVLEGGTAAALNIPGISIAAKTGTAQVGVRNEFMNSWVIGFWPFEKPRYAFAVVLERSPAGTLSGASPAMNPFFTWLRDSKPEYIE